MVNEAVQNYVNQVSGLTRTTRAKAVAGAKTLLAQAGLDDVASDAGERAAKLADEIVSASKANRQLMRNLIASEVEQIVARLGLARVEEVDRLRAELRDLQESVRGRAPAAPAADDLPARNAAARKAATKKTPAKKPAAKKTPAKKTAVQKAAAQQATPADPSGESDG